MTSAQTGWTDLKTIELKGLRVSLTAPRLVARSKGYLWFPSLQRFPDGTLLAVMSSLADVHVNQTAALYAWSRDGGRSWSAPTRSAYSDVALPAPAGHAAFALRLPYYLFPDGPTAMRGDAIRVDPATQSVAVEPGAIRVTGLPRTWKALAAEVQTAGFVFNGQAVARRDGRFLTTLYGMFADETKYSLLAATSADGRTWAVTGEIAGSDCALDGPEGPCESALGRLQDGRLMCIFRTGGPPYGQCWSQDEGRTWTTPVAIAQARSVQPSLAVMQDGTVALSGGRPGIFLWVNADGTGNDWQAVDVQAHHNACCPAETIDGIFLAARTTSSCYTEVVGLDEEQLLLIYDRVPHGWAAIPPDSSETNSVWVVRIKVCRDAATTSRDAVSFQLPLGHTRQVTTR